MRWTWPWWMVLVVTQRKELRLHPLEGPLEARCYRHKSWPSNSNSDNSALTDPLVATRWCYCHDSTSTWIRSHYRSICNELWNRTLTIVCSADGLRTTNSATHGICLTYAIANGLRTAHAATDGLSTADAIANGLWLASTAMGSAYVAAWLRLAHIGIADAATGIPDAATGIPSVHTRIPLTIAIWLVALLWTTLNKFNKN